MNKKNKHEKKNHNEGFLDDFLLDDDEFFMAEEIEGYDQCSGYNSQKCMSDCSFPIVVPFIVTLN